MARKEVYEADFGRNHLRLEGVTIKWYWEQTRKDLQAEPDFSEDEWNEQFGREVGALITHCGLNKEDYILDIGCGEGRHLAPFAQQGFRNVVGFDASIDRLTVAKKRAGDSNLGTNLVYGNWNALPFKQVFNFAYMFFSAGGSEEDQQKATFDTVSMVLTPSGKIAFEFVDEKKIREEYRDVNPQTKEKIVEGIPHLITNQLDPKEMVEQSRDEWREDGQTKVVEMSRRIQTIKEYERVFKSAGFRVEDIARDVHIRRSIIVPDEYSILIASR